MSSDGSGAAAFPRPRSASGRGRRRSYRRAIGRTCIALVAMALATVAFAPAAGAATTLNLLPGTGVLLSKSGSGALSSTSTSTNTFSPAAYADYKHFGGEPTVTVDRYPVTSGAIKGQTCTSAKPCYPDYAYACSPQGFVDPHYSTFLKSSDMGETFRATDHIPVQGAPVFDVGGGGDCYIAVGQVTHKVFFTDLPGTPCVTLNTSSDFGETFPGSDGVACGANPGAIDDRNWVAADEYTGPSNPTQNVYISFINYTNDGNPALVGLTSTQDGAPGSFAASSCNLATDSAGSVPVTGGVQAPDTTPTACPDPADTYLDIAGPVVVDVHNTHDVFIPFIRATPQIPGLTAGPPYSLWIAKSSDHGQTWTRTEIANLATHDPANIFPEVTIDNAGNLYYTWSQTQTASEAAPGLGGEQDVYYAYSTDQATTWSQPIDLTNASGKSAIMPWMVAGDAGQVDLVYYQANTGLNSNVAFVDQSGNPSNCTSPDGSTCFANPAVWNVYFSQSQNALNTGKNFKAVQISSEPNHLGQICTAGLACSTGGNRNLLDFFTVDLDHLGAANVIWADDNNASTNDVDKFSRQLAGSSVFKNTNISLASSWPIQNHSVTDPAGDVYDTSGLPKASCPGMDLLGTSERYSGGVLTITDTLNNAPTAAEATACGGTATTGGVWGAEFWAASADGGHNFYIAYRDNPPDGSPRGEVGYMDHTNATLTSLDFDPQGAATVGGTCFSGGQPTNTSPCTVTLTTPLSSLGAKSGAGLYSITGLAVYAFGSQTTPVPFTNVNLANNEEADATTAFDDNGTGTTTG